MLAPARIAAASAAADKLSIRFSMGVSPFLGKLG